MGRHPNHACRFQRWRMPSQLGQGGSKGVSRIGSRHCVVLNSPIRLMGPSLFPDATSVSAAEPLQDTGASRGFTCHELEHRLPQAFVAHAGAFSFQSGAAFAPPKPWRVERSKPWFDARCRQSRVSGAWASRHVLTEYQGLNQAPKSTPSIPELEGSAAKRPFPPRHPASKSAREVTLTNNKTIQ